MSQIFVSHSGTGPPQKSNQFLVLRGVMFEEFEAILKGPAKAQRIAQDIRQSNAVFLLLGKHVEELKHTQDWVG